MNQPAFDAAFRAQLHSLFAWRRDVRRFRSDPLPDGTVERIVQAASLAPAVGLIQPWRFVTVDSTVRRGAIIASFKRMAIDTLARNVRTDLGQVLRLELAALREAPVHLATFCDLSTTEVAPTMLEVASAMAVNTLWLDAHAHGIGVGWISMLEPDVLAEALDLPANWRFVGYFCLGYAVDEPTEVQHEFETRDEAAARILRR
ncbi:MAG: 5,6-dimethylbenzimidazole synthase [Vulcanimicrobiaceae bacterium]